MAKGAVKQPVELVDEVVTKEKRKPDFGVFIPQQPQRKQNGALVASGNDAFVGVAWRNEWTDPDTGETVEFINVKTHVKCEVGPEGMTLKTYREAKK